MCGEERAFSYPRRPGVGIIPACAGKRSKGLRRGWRTRDHPRVCGEEATNSWIAIKNKGSSPRVRGRANGVLTKTWANGIIPACAGKRRGQFRFQFREWDHPRVCGEESASGRLVQFGDGSSPRVRGRVDLATLTLGGPGIIPACAGKRRSATLSLYFLGDHPRVCGEESFRYTRRQSFDGSSPRVRRRVWRAAAFSAASGIIPACAGKSG